MKQETKHTIQLISAVVLVVFGVLLVGVAFFFPPAGEISPSVLTAYGETLSFAGAIMGLDYRYKAKNDNN